MVGPMMHESIYNSISTSNDEGNCQTVASTAEDEAEAWILASAASTGAKWQIDDDCTSHNPP